MPSTRPRRETFTTDSPRRQTSNDGVQGKAAAAAAMFRRARHYRTAKPLEHWKPVTSSGTDNKQQTLRLTVHET